MVIGTAGYKDFLVKEAVEIWLHLDNFNKDTGYPVSHS
jgi:hypothetical protein